MYGHLAYQYTDTTQQHPYYVDIYPHPKATALCDHIKPIYQLEFELASDQTPPILPNCIEYWGWLRKGETQLSMIHPTYNLFKTCFPYALEDHIEHDEGKAYKLILKSANCIYKHNGVK